MTTKTLVKVSNVVPGDVVTGRDSDVTFTVSRISTTDISVILWIQADEFEIPWHYRPNSEVTVLRP